MVDQELDSVRRNIITVHQKEPFLGLSILCPSFLFLPLRRPVASAASRHSQENRPFSVGPGLTRLQAQGWRVKPVQTGEGVGLWRTEGACLDEKSGNAALLNTMLAGGHPGLPFRAGHAGQRGERAAGDRRLSGAHRTPW